MHVLLDEIKGLTLVADKRYVRHALVVEGSTNEAVPVFEVLKALVVGDVVH